MAHYEIERKYLIDMPEEELLCRQPGCAIWDIEQIYLLGNPGETRRIRRVTEKGEARYYQTIKKRVSAATAEESEARIDQAAYARLSAERDPSLRTILKRRYRIPFRGRMLEIDVYPFWKEQAVLEIELESEADPVSIPEWLRVRREVTDEKRYKNVALARAVPEEKCENPG